jgi:diketogulonate reductase-like aldo/keto reductase
VGAGIATAIAEGLVTREELWVTSKLWNTYHAAEHVELALRKTLTDLNLDYVDLYLIHFPIPLRFVPFDTLYPPEWVCPETGKMEMARVPARETWGAMEKLKGLGLAKHIGVSNFNPALLADLLTTATIAPEVNQVELHPYLQQQQLVDFCASVNVEVTGFSPLGHSSYVEIGGGGLTDGVVGVINEPFLAEIGGKYGKTAAQVALRYTVQRGCSIVPKSTNAGRLAENLAIFDFMVCINTELLFFIALQTRSPLRSPPTHFPTIQSFLETRCRALRRWINICASTTRASFASLWACPRAARFTTRQYSHTYLSCS